MHTLDSSHYGYLAQEVIPGYSPTPSPPYSPFLQSETLFTFPATAAGYNNEVARDSWRYGESQSQPPSPGYTEGYHHPQGSGLFLSDSPLLSQSATSLNTGHEIPDPRYTMMTPVSDIPETVRFSGTSLSHLAPETVYTQDQSFGHNILYTAHSSSQPHQMYQQPSNNLQVQQWNNMELVLPLQDDRSKLSSISETDSSEVKSEARSGEAEMFEEEGEDEEEEEESGFSGGIVRCKWADCSLEFPDMKGLVTHINSQHIQSKRGSEEYPCFWKNCGRTNKPFNAKYKLVTHLRVHTGERPFRCKQRDCGRSFARLENLKIHNRSHTGEKPFLCKFFKECNKAFSNSSDRAKHEQTHRDPKPYKCDVHGCHKRYTDPSSLRKHVKNHSLEDQEQARMVKEASKEPVVRRGSLPDILHPHHHHQGHLHHHWSGSQPNLDSDLLMASSASASAGSLHLMSGGGLVTTCHESMSRQESCHEPLSRHEACHDSVTSLDMGGEPQWSRRLETEDHRGYHQHHYTYYNSSLHVEV